MPIVGETSSVIHDVTATSAFVYDTTPKLYVLQPDGNYLSPPDGPAVTVTPGTSSITQRLSAVISWAFGGPYTLEWRNDIGPQNLIKHIEIYFATWNNVYDIIRSRLQMDSTTLPDKLIDYVLFQVNAQILSQFSDCLTSYNDISDVSYRMYYDFALSFLASEVLRGFIGTTSAATELIEVQVGTDKYKYASPAQSGFVTISPENRLIGDAYNMLSMIPCIATELSSVRDANIFKPAGRRRYAREVFGLTADNPVYEAYYDVVAELTWGGEDA